VRPLRDIAFKCMNTTHRLLIKASRGRLGWTVADMPVVRLTTIGRKSGQRRQTLLTSPYRDGTTIVLVASRGGDEQDPTWYLNLRANPTVEVAMGGDGPTATSTPMLARIASPDERARLWPLITAAHPRYAGYQSRTERVIPVVLLTAMYDANGAAYGSPLSN
jgi:deazaflavin-dependent oxidoreductase (nitroreductase family)